MLKRLRSLNKGSVAGWFQQACAAIGAFVALPLYMKYLGQIQAGQWLTFQSLFALASLSDLGFSYITTRQTAAVLGAQDGGAEKASQGLLAGWPGVSQVFKLTKSANYISCGITLLLLSLWILTSKYQNVDKPSVGLGNGFVLAALGIAILIKLSNRPFAAVLDGSGFLYITRITAGVQMLVITAGSCFLAVSYGKIELLSAWAVISAFAETIFLRWYLGSSTDLHKWKGTPPAKGWNLKTVSMMALPLGIVNIGGFLISSVQLPLLSASLGPAEVAPYYVAQRIAQFFNVAVMQLVYPALPQFTRQLAAGELDSAKKKYLNVVRLVQGLSIVGSLLFVTCVPLVSQHLFKVPPLPEKAIILMGVDMCLFNCSLIYGHFVLASGDNPLWRWVILTGCLNVVILYILLPKLGVVAMPVASLTASFATLYGTNIFYGRRLTRSFKRGLVNYVPNYDKSLTRS